LDEVMVFVVMRRDTMSTAKMVVGWTGGPDVVSMR
jgi:hypothetical protein